MRVRSVLPVLFLLAGAALAAELRPTLTLGEAAAGEDEAALWRAARNALNPDAVWRYLDRFPRGRYTDNARHRLGVLGVSPGRRFDGQWAGEVRCGSGAEWQSLPLAAEIDNGRVRTRRGGRGDRHWWEAAGTIWPDGGVEFEGSAINRINDVKGDGQHPLYFAGLLMGGSELDARGHLGPLLCVMAFQRVD